MARAPLQGLDFAPYQVIHRLIGIDQMHVSGLGRKFWETSDSIISSAKACLTPVSGSDAFDDRAMPVVAGGSTVLQAEPTYRGIGSSDLIYVCGSGILSHPGGPSQGLRGMVEAWEGAMQNIDLATYAQSHPALAAAVDFWSRPAAR